MLILNMEIGLQSMLMMKEIFQEDLRAQTGNLQFANSARFRLCLKLARSSQ